VHRARLAGMGAREWWQARWLPPPHALADPWSAAAGMTAAAPRRLPRSGPQAACMQKRVRSLQERRLAHFFGWGMQEHRRRAQRKQAATRHRRRYRQVFSREMQGGGFGTSPADLAASSARRPLLATANIPTTAQTPPALLNALFTLAATSGFKGSIITLPAHT
jgi:hypothetical protein